MDASRLSKCDTGVKADALEKNGKIDAKIHKEFSIEEKKTYFGGKTEARVK